MRTDFLPVCQLSSFYTRPNDKLYMCPSNTFIASNGDVYEIEPFMLPPPTEIAALFKELKDRRDRSDSVTIDSDTRTPKVAFKQKANKNVDLNDTHRVFLLSKPSNNEKQIDRLTVPSFDSPINQKFCRSRSKEMKSSPRAKALNSKGQLKNDKAGVTTSVVIAEDVPSEKESESDNGSTQSRSDIISRQSLARYRNRNLNNTNNNENSRKPESSIGAYPTFLHTDQPGQKNRDEEMFDWDNFSIKKYLLTEMLGVGETGHLQPAAVGHMQNFLTVPSKVEAFVGFGFFICLDAFLNVLTFLPLRMAYSLGLLGCEVLGNVLLTVLGVSLIASASQYKSLKKSLRGRFQMCHLYDLMRGVFMLISCYVLLKLNMSRVYHYIRGQTLIKLYVLSAMLEIFDKLLCSFGQDAFDSLYCITRMRPDPRSIFFAFLVTAVYTTLHSGLYFMSIATLTVAINSADQALVTVLVLNNFGEIKSFVFKKFDNQNLFQLSCADVTERFQLVRNHTTQCVYIIVGHL
jgi:Eukaryotic membrane protein family